MSERIVVPAREGRAVRVEAGRSFRVIDVEGGQVADTWAFVADDPGEFHSAQHTRAVNSALFPPLGGQFVTNARRPILTLEEDATPGIHDMLIAACDPPRYIPLGVTGWHASCE
ncbi:MAG TPA: urea carboxylase-associated family protein, partial [Gaiellaceae bacterium]